MLRCVLSLTLLSIMCLYADAYADGVKFLAPKAIISRITEKNTVLLDVRTPKEYSDGHLKNSILINAYDPMFKEKINKLDKTKTYIVYCHSGGRSHFASDYMKKVGFKKLIDMKGGITRWKKSKLEIVK